MANKMNVTFTSEKQYDFLCYLSETGNISQACNLIGITKATAYNKKERDLDFSVRWDEAIENAGDLLVEEARRRGCYGVTKTVRYQGEVVGYEQEYSDSLLTFLIKHKVPGFNDKLDITHSTNKTFADLVRNVTNNENEATT